MNNVGKSIKRMPYVQSIIVTGVVLGVQREVGGGWVMSLLLINSLVSKLRDSVSSVRIDLQGTEHVSRRRRRLSVCRHTRRPVIARAET